MQLTFKYLNREVYIKFVRSNVNARALMFGSIVAIISACGGGGTPTLTSSLTTTPTTSSVSGALIINGIEAPAPAGPSVSNLSYADEPTTNVESPIVIGQGIILLNAEFQVDGRATLQRIIERHPDLAIKKKDEVTPQGPFLVTFGNSDSVASTLQALEMLRTDSAVRNVEPEVTAKMLATGGKLEPNDLGYPLQKKSLELIGMPTAWATTVGKPSFFVAVLDTGIFAAHPDLKDNLLIGYDFADNDTYPEATKGATHGTHVAGTVAALGNNRHGVVGVAWKSRVVLRVQLVNATLYSYY